MLVKLRDHKGNAIVQELMDISNIDMCVKQKEDKFQIHLNRNYYLDEEFDSLQDAEASMFHLADQYNVLEYQILKESE